MAWRQFGVDGEEPAVNPGVREDPDLVDQRPITL